MSGGDLMLVMTEKMVAKTQIICLKMTKNFFLLLKFYWKVNYQGKDT